MSIDSSKICATLHVLIAEIYNWKCLDICHLWDSHTQWAKLCYAYLPTLTGHEQTSPCRIKTAMQMYGAGLMDLPEDLLSQVIYMLPLTERARLEAVCKQFHHLSTKGSTKIDISIRTEEESKGLLVWLGKLGKEARSRVQTLSLVCSIGCSFPIQGESTWSSTLLLESRVTDTIQVSRLGPSVKDPLAPQNKVQWTKFNRFCGYLTHIPDGTDRSHFDTDFDMGLYLGSEYAN